MAYCDEVYCGLYLVNSFQNAQNIRKVIREKFISLWRRPNSSFPAFVFVQTAPRHCVYWQVSYLWIQLETLTDCVQLFRFKNITLKFNEKAIKTYIVMTNFAGPIRWIRFRIPQNICKPVREKSFLIYATICNHAVFVFHWVSLLILHITWISHEVCLRNPLCTPL